MTRPTPIYDRVTTTALALVVALMATTMVLGWSVGSAESARPSSLVAINPARLVDTRPGQPTVDGRQAGDGRLVAGQIMSVQIAGRGGVPGDATAAMMNITVVSPFGGGYATVFPCGSQPETSTVNFAAGSVTASAAFVELADGRACVFALGSPHIVVDVQGAATGSSELAPDRLARLLDTRPGGETVDGKARGEGIVGAGETVGVPMLGRTNLSDDADGALLVLTAVNPQADGYLTAYACGTGRPDGSVLNYSAGRDTATSVFVRVGTGDLCIYTSAPTHIVADTSAFTRPSSQLDALASPRLADTRPDGLTDDAVLEAIGAVRGGTTLEVPVAGRSGSSIDAHSALLKVIAISPEGPGYLTVYDCDAQRPVASNINVNPGQVLSNLVFAPLSSSGSVCVFASQTTHVVVDLEGTIASERSVAPPSTPTTPTNPDPIIPTNTAGFVHPGVMVDAAQLDEIAGLAAAGVEPWASAADDLRGAWYGKLGYEPNPVPVLRAASGGNRSYVAARGWTNAGDESQLNDARAAYTHALLWSLTGNQAHADKAIQIMNAWSSTLTEIKFDQPRRDDNNSQVWNNGKLQAGWGGSLFARAAEIIRYSGAGWSSSDIADFEDMLTDVYLPLTITGWSNGANWLMTLTEATIAIGVFTNDRDAFDQGIDMWRDLAPTTIYHPSDGADPIPPKAWYDTPSRMRSLWFQPSSYVPGLQGETLRDLSHMTMGLGAMSNGAATAAIQGVDLFGEQSARIVLGYETNAGYVNDYLDEVERRGGSEPTSSWRPDGWVGPNFRTGGTAYKSGWEVAFQHYTESGESMPETARLVNRLRDLGGNQAALHLSWETLTHAG